MHADKSRKPAITLKANDLEYVRTSCLRYACPCPKLGYSYSGPFRIKSTIGSNSFELELPTGLSVNPVFDVSHLKEWTERPARLGPVPPPPVVGRMNGGEYDVLRVTGERTRNGRKQFRMVWASFVPEQETWNWQRIY